MRALHVLTCCWPGLCRLWLKGDKSGLAPAVLCAVALNGLLWFSFGLANPPAIAWQLLAWGLLAAVWGILAWREFTFSPEFFGRAREQDEGLFIAAQAQYLQGNWFEAEQLALELAGAAPGDCENQLLLASIYRRMKRYPEARRILENASQLIEAKKWSFEIAAELRLISQRIASSETLDPEEVSANDAIGPESIARAA